jgi:hypothetical protein
MVRGYDPDKHATQVEKGVKDLEETITKHDDKITNAKKAAETKATAKAAADKKVSDLEADKRILVGRLDQAKAVLATLQNPGEAKVEVGDSADESQDSLPV